MTESVAGKLLIASPSMPDYFHRTVILVVEHNDQGAFGLVLNRPSETTVGEAAPELAELIGDRHLIHVGGPVQPNAVTAIGDHSDPDEATKLLVGPVGMVDLDDPPELHRLRVFVGYAGWGPEQLDGELQQDAWIVEQVSPDDPSPTEISGRRCWRGRAASTRSWRGCRPIRPSTSRPRRPVGCGPWRRR